MRLLVLTQKVDIEDGVLGFFHGWLKKMAVSFEKINVICLQKGKIGLPSDIQIFSLGKESGESKIKYLVRFYKYVWQLRNEYDAVFIHMNAIYVVLGGLIWLLKGKKVVLWYNHRYGNIVSRLAYLMVSRVLYTSPFSFFAGCNRVQQMPAGIDMDLFKADSSVKKTDNSILCLGRIAPIKNIEVLIEAARLLSQDNNKFVLSIVGDALTKDRSYFDKIKFSAKELEAASLIKFMGEVPNHKSPQIYNQNGIFVNLTNSGSLDKTILEAMACESVIVVNNQYFKGVLPVQFIFEENCAEDLKNKLTQVLRLQEDQKKEIGKKFREYVIKNHSLDLLIAQLHTIFEKS